MAERSTIRTVCTRCQTAPRAPKQRWCKACRAAWMQTHRPRGPRSWRVCPACLGKATKRFSLATWLYTCQQCGHQYAAADVSQTLSFYNSR